MYRIIKKCFKKVTALKNLVEQFNWDDITNENVNSDDGVLSFTDRFMNLCTACFTSKTVLIRDLENPWFTSDRRRNDKNKR